MRDIRNTRKFRNRKKWVIVAAVTATATSVGLVENSNTVSAATENNQVDNVETTTSNNADSTGSQNNLSTTEKNEEQTNPSTKGETESYTLNNASVSKQQENATSLNTSLAQKNTSKYVDINKEDVGATVIIFTVPTGFKFDNNEQTYGKYTGMHSIENPTQANPQSPNGQHKNYSVKRTKDGNFVANYMTPGQETTAQNTHGTSFDITIPDGYEYDADFTRLSDPDRFQVFNGQNGDSKVTFDFSKYPADIGHAPSSESDPIRNNAFQIFVKVKDKNSSIRKAQDAFEQNGNAGIKPLHSNSYEGMLNWFDDDGYYLGTSVLDDYSKGNDSSIAYKVHAPAGYKFDIDSKGEYSKTGYVDNTENTAVGIKSGDEHVGIYYPYLWAQNGEFDGQDAVHFNGAGVHFFRMYVHKDNTWQEQKYPTALAGATKSDQRAITFLYYDVNTGKFVIDNNGKILEPIVGSTGQTQTVKLPQGYVINDTTFVDNLGHNLPSTVNSNISASKFENDLKLTLSSDIDDGHKGEVVIHVTRYSRSNTNPVHAQTATRTIEFEGVKKPPVSQSSKYNVVQWLDNITKKNIYAKITWDDSAKLPSFNNELDLEVSGYSYKIYRVNADGTKSEVSKFTNPTDTDVFPGLNKLSLEGNKQLSDQVYNEKYIVEYTELSNPGLEEAKADYNSAKSEANKVTVPAEFANDSAVKAAKSALDAAITNGDKATTKDAFTKATADVNAKKEALTNAINAANEAKKSLEEAISDANSAIVSAEKYQKTEKTIQQAINDVNALLNNRNKVNVNDSVAVKVYAKKLKSLTNTLNVLVSNLSSSNVSYTDIASLAHVMEDKSTSTPSSFENNGVQRLISHNAYIYDKDGNRVGSFKYVVNTKVWTSKETVSIKGQQYYKIGDNQYIKAVNFDKKVSKTKQLRRNSFVYNSKGRRISFKLIRKHSKMKVYGVKKIRGKKYYRIGRNRYVKAVNFR